MRLLVGRGSRHAAMPPRPVRDQIKDWGSNLDLYLAGNRYHFPVPNADVNKAPPAQPPASSEGQDVKKSSQAIAAAAATPAPKATPPAAFPMLRPLLPRNIKQCLKSGPGEGARALGKERLKHAECFFGE